MTVALWEMRGSGPHTRTRIHAHTHTQTLSLSLPLSMRLFITTGKYEAIQNQKIYKRYYDATENNNKNILLIKK